MPFDALTFDPVALAHLAVSLTCLAVGVAVGWYLLPPRTRWERHEVVPPELSRLAKNLGITEDIPASQSYGRMIGDMFREKDETLWLTRRAHERELEELSQSHADLWDDLQVLKAREVARQADLAQEARKASARIKAAVDTHDPAQTIPFTTFTTYTPLWTPVDFWADDSDEV